MSKKVTILGRKVLPIWLAVVLLIASGAGAAVGSILAGKVTGEINVSTTGSAGGLLIGGPYCDLICHTPNDANEENDDSDVDENPTGTWDILADQIDDYGDIAFSDDAYEQTPDGEDIAQQMYKFYVGDEDNISQIVITWEGYSSASGGKLQVYDEAATAWDTDMEEAIPTADAERTITIDSSTNVTVAGAVAGGNVYVQAFTVADEDLWTDYIKVCVTYTTIDWTTWTGFSGPEISERVFVVPDRCIGVHSDDQTGFEAAAELGVGDWWIFMLPIKNASNQDIIAKLCMEVPSCLNVYVLGPDEIGDFDPRIHDVVRIALNCWKFIVDEDAEKQDGDDYIYIMLNAHDDCAPGMFVINGTLEQITY